MTLNTTKTVRELAAETPGATRVFERLRIDYCCGGSKPIADACAAVGVNLEELSRLLDEAGAKDDSADVDFMKAPLSEVIRHIIDTHHVFTREEMGRIGALLAKVCGKHVGNHPEVLQVGALFRRLCEDLAPHMLKEEQVLFPYILRLEAAAGRGLPPPFAPFGTVNNPVRMMMFEHDTAGDLLREIRAAASDFRPPADACFSFRTLYAALEEFEQDLHRHVHLENNVLFPRAVELEAAAHV